MALFDSDDFPEMIKSKHAKRQREACLCCLARLPRRKDGTTRGANYLFDFRLKPKGSTKSRWFHGSTSQTTFKAAERVEARLEELAKLGQLSNAMTVAEACEKYWDQKMQHVRSAKDQATNLEVVSTYLGPETLLVDITPALIADAALRRARTPQRAYNRKTKTVELTKQKTTPSTVNRQLIQTLRRLLKYSRYTLGVPIDLTQFEWGALQYEQAEERNREIGAAEEVRYWNALRADYHPIVELYLIPAAGAPIGWACSNPNANLPPALCACRSARRRSKAS